MLIHYVRLLIKTSAVMLLGVWIISYFFYIDLEESCIIRLDPGVLSLIEFNHANIKEGLRVLKYGEPEIYRGVCDNIDTIASEFGCGGWQGGCHYGEKGRITLSTTRNEFVGWTAAVIGHEYCHDVQLREKRGLEERECYLFDHAILQSVVETYP